MEKIIIVGGGIAGLSAGIHAAREGFEPIIYEKNSVAGGNCSAWERGEYVIDNCLHWLTGTKEGTPQYAEWLDLGVIKEGDNFIKREAFYSSEYNGETVTLWRDLERTERELLELSPEDAKEIHRFIECTKLGMSLQTPRENFWDMKYVFNEGGITVSRSKMAMILFQYAGMSLEELGSKFKHPLLQKMIVDFMAKDYEALWIVMAYSFFIAENGDLPEGGSRSVVEKLVKTYLEAGGKLYLNAPVSSVIIGREHEKIIRQVYNTKEEDTFTSKSVSAKKATGILLSSGEFVPADHVICACDINYTFNKLLKKKYFPKSIVRAYKKNKKCTMYSSFQVAFSVDGTMDDVDTLYFDCEPFDVGLHTFDRINIKNYRLYGDYIAPPGKTVIQCSIVQYTDDFHYWHKLHKNINLYRQTKKNIGDAILYRLENRFPKYEGKIFLLDAWTPYTYSKRNNCYNGSYMRFITTFPSPNAFLSCEVKKLANVYLASQWLRYPGGVPSAAITGRMAIKSIMENNKNKNE